MSATMQKLINDAGALLASAQQLLDTLDPESGQYQAVNQAMNYLRSLIGSENPSQNDVAAAMSLLTQAMAGIY